MPAERARIHPRSRRIGASLARARLPHVLAQRALQVPHRPPIVLYAATVVATSGGSATSASAPHPQTGSSEVCSLCLCTHSAHKLILQRWHCHIGLATVPMPRIWTTSSSPHMSQGAYEARAKGENEREAKGEGDARAITSGHESASMAASMAS